MKKILKQIIATFHESELKTIKSRSLKIDFNCGKIVSIIGPRRAGKSSYLFYLMHQLLTQGIKKTQMVYINFEDERINLEGSDLSLLLEAYQELYPEEDLQNVYFFFDEIQNVSGWEKFVRRIYDEDMKHLFISGSNAKLLSKEIDTSLRGRSISYEILSLSFSELLSFKEFKKSEFSSQGKTELLRLQNEYLQRGGFVEIQDLEEETKIKILQEYFEVMMYNDLIERYHIKDVFVLKYFIKSLLQSVTKEFSINKIANDLKSQGLSFDKNTLYQYLEYLQTIYFFKTISQRDKSLKKQTLKKIYTFDTGYLTAMNFQFSQENGKKLENTVFNQLYRIYGDQIFFFKTSKAETDFIVEKRGEIGIFQVCFELTPENRKREYAGCLEAMKFFHINESYLITAEQEEDIDLEGHLIHVVPFYQYFRNLQKK